MKQPFRRTLRMAIAIEVSCDDDRMLSPIVADALAFLSEEPGFIRGVGQNPDAGQHVLIHVIDDDAEMHGVKVFYRAANTYHDSTSERIPTLGAVDPYVLVPRPKD